MTSIPDTRIFCKLQGGSESRFKVVCFSKQKYTSCFPEFLVQEIASLWDDDVPAATTTGILLLVAGGASEEQQQQQEDQQAVVEDVHHLRDGDKCIFVPNNITTRMVPPVSIKTEDLSLEEQEPGADPVQEQHYPDDDDDDDDDDSELKDHDDNHDDDDQVDANLDHDDDDDDSDDDKPLTTTLKNNNTSPKTTSSTISKKNQSNKKANTTTLKTTTDGRKRAVVLKKNQSNKKANNKKANNNNNNNNNNNTKKHTPLKIASRFFLWDDGVDYPAFVKKLPGQTHGQQIIPKGHYYVKWINFPGGKVVGYEELLPFTQKRSQEYQEWEEHITMESDSEDDDDDNGDDGDNGDGDDPKQDHGDDGDDPKQDQDESSDHDADNNQEKLAKCPQIGSRFFAVKDGLQYLALVKKMSGAKHDKKIIPKGYCYIKWIGYHGGTICKVSDLLKETEWRRRAYRKREMQMAMESSSDDDEEQDEEQEKTFNPKDRPGADKKNDKRQNSSTTAPLAADASDDEEGFHDSQEEESKGEEINQAPEVGKKFFVLQKDVPYPVVVVETPHKKQPIVQGTCTVKWIGYRGGKVVHYSDLLAYTERRQREYRELTNRDVMARKAKIEKRNERSRLGKKRKAEEEKQSKKRQKMETKRSRAKDLDLLYGPATDLSGLQEIWKENQAEGRILAEPEKNRFVYFARDSDTPQDVAREFKVDVEKIVFDNIKFTKRLTKSSPLVSFTPIVIPIKWGGSTVENPCRVVKQEDGGMRSNVVEEDVAASPAYIKPLLPSQQGSVSVTPTQN